MTPANASPGSREAPPLVMHVVYSFKIGGLENGIVNLVNLLPKDEFRHVIVALTTCDERFCNRIHRDDVELVSLNKLPGHGWRVFPKVWRLCRARRPAIVHTRNLAALEMQLPAFAAGVPVRIHGEHGRDVSDPDGTRFKYKMVRRAYEPFVTRFVTVSSDLERYLTDGVGIAEGKVTRICNGVDESSFGPDALLSPPLEEQSKGGPLIIGSVGRLQEIKGQHVLIAAVHRLLDRAPRLAGRFRLRLVGDGPLRPTIEREVAERGLGDIVELVGERDDIASVMRHFDLFVLPSLGEGISNTVLEAMASALPVVATAVGGNFELVMPNETGVLVPPNDAEALASALEQYLESPELRKRHGRYARAIVEGRFSLASMVERYRSLYHAALSERPLPSSS